MLHSLLKTGTYKNLSLLPLVLVLPLVVLSFSPHWAYDEATTFVMMHNNTALELIRYDKFQLANHHALNTLYMYAVQQLGWSSLILFRLPSLLLFFAYYWLTGRLLQQQHGYKLHHIDQLMLHAWPYFVYFAQARGYALAMVAFLGALLVMKHYLRQGKAQQLLLFILLGSLSSVAIFSFLFPFTAMIIVIIISRFRQFITRPSHIFIFTLAIPALLYIFDKGQLVSKYDVSIIGRDSLFRGGTLSSLVSFLTLNEFAPRHLFLVFKVVLSLSLLPVMYIMVRRMQWYVELSVVLVSLLLLVFCHYVLGAQYPVYRGAAYIIILLLLSFTYSNFNRNIFFTATFSIIILLGLYYLGSLLFINSRKGMNDALSYVATSPGVVAVDDVNLAPTAANYMLFNGRLTILNTCADVDYPCFERMLDTAKYAICLEGRMEHSPRRDEFKPLFKVATFFDYKRVFYKRKEE